MNILDIYSKYPITKSLLDHQIRAAAIGAFLAEKLNKDIKLNKTALIQALLIHDMGNIIKFDFSNTSLFTNEENENLQYWKAQQDKLIEKYGDEHLATFEIAKEINASSDVLEILTKTGSSNLHKTVANNDWNFKIASYADLRCAPHGVVSLNKRFEDIRKRYKNVKHQLSIPEEVEKRIILSLQLEEQLKQNINYDLDKISDQVIEVYKDKVEKITLP